MNLLGAKLYDPSSSATKACTANIAMTAFDTTNLRLTVTVPAHGMVQVRMRCAIEGAATYPQILLGVMVGAAVSGRVAPQVVVGGTALATTRAVAEAVFTIPGLAPGSTVFDAAYGVEFLVAASNIRYGGPNNTTASDAWGGFLFEIWDPAPLQVSSQPLQIDANGRVDLGEILGTAVAAPATAGILDVNVKNMNNVSGSPITTVKAVQGLATDGVIPTATNLTNLPAITSNWLTAAGIAASALNGKGDWNIGKTGYALSSAGVQAIWDALTSALTAVGSIGKKLADWTIGTAQTGDAFARLGAPAGASVSADIVAVKTDTAAIKTKTDNLPASPAAVGSAMTLTSGERTAIANEVETQIIDETDAEKVLTAITDKIAAVNPDLGGLTVSAIASGVRTNLATELGRIDVAVSSRGTGVALDAAGIRSAVGMNTANLDTQLGDVPTNSELTAAIAAGDDPVLSAIGGLNNVSSAQVAAAAAAAIAAYDPPTRAEATSDKDEVITQVNANETKIDTLQTSATAIQAKTDPLTFTKANEIDANMQSVNGVTVAGTGAVGDEWGP